jgi:transcriptional regulatory protein RtcR
MAAKRVLGISILGEQRDAFIMKRPERRWSNFRPSVAFALQKTVPLDEFCLIYQPNQQRQEEFCKQAKEDIETLSREARQIPIPVQVYPVEFEDPYDLNECYRVLFESMNQILANKGEEWEVIANLNTGTHTMHMAIYMIALRFPRPILLQQVQPGEREGAEAKSAHTINATLRGVTLNPKKDEKARGEEISQRLLIIKTQHPEVKELMHEIGSVGRLTNEPILLGGPTGCGKTKLALEIHRLWCEVPVKTQKKIKEHFVSANCAVFHGSRDLAYSELFGHVKGAFTGATQDR